jgi:hypothetical protein
MTEPVNEERKLQTDSVKIIHDYGWNWFSHHAAQRMTVFRFFFLLLGGFSVGFYQTLPRSPAIACMFSILAFFLSILFWRLDLRTRELVRIGEDLLLKTESKLTTLGEMDFGIISVAKGKNSPHATRLSPAWFYSYAQIFSAIFALMVGSSALAAFYSFSQIPGVQKAFSAWTGGAKPGNLQNKQ